jgi:hypothetical protein
MTEPCGRCHEVHDPRKCQAHVMLRNPAGVVEGLRQCRRWPMAGQEVCAFHGGRAKRAKIAARRRMSVKQVEQAVATFGLRRDIGRAEALLEELQWTAGHVEYLRGEVQKLTAAGLSWGTESKVNRSGGTGARNTADDETVSKAGIPIVVELYQRERRHLLEVIRVCSATNVDDALVSLAQNTGTAWSAWTRWLVEGVLRAVGLTVGQLEPERWATIREVVVVMLRGVIAGDPAPEAVEQPAIEP